MTGEKISITKFVFKTGLTFKMYFSVVSFRCLFSLL